MSNVDNQNPRARSGSIKVYLSLPMSGTPDEGRALAVSETARIRIALPDAEIVDPTLVPTIYYPGTQYLDYRATILQDLLLLDGCDMMWLAGDWWMSLGCMIELERFRSRTPPPRFLPKPSIACAVRRNDIFVNPISLVVMPSAWANLGKAPP